MTVSGKWSERNANIFINCVQKHLEYGNKQHVLTVQLNNTNIISGTIMDIPEVLLLEYDICATDAKYCIPLDHDEDMLK